MRTTIAVGLGVWLGLGCQLLAAPVGTAFTYSGRLNDKSTGRPASGSYEMRFQLYEVATDGKPIAGPVVVSPVTVGNGVFGAEVDFGAGVFGQDAARWMEVAVRPAGSKSDFDVFAKRQRLTAVPYSLQAETARTANEANSLVLKGGTIRVAGAGINTATPVFVHRADKSNVQGNVTLIDNPATNDDPNAIVIVTHNWTADQAPNKYDKAPTGVYYTGTRWAIFHEDLSPMEVGRAFNVMIVKP